MKFPREKCKPIILFSSVADPFHFDIDPDPRIRFVKYQLLFTFYFYKNIFLRNMICYVIYGVNIYVSKHKFNSFEKNV